MFGIKSKFSFTAEFAELAEFNPPYVWRVNFDFFSAFSAVNSPFDFNVR